MSKLETRQGASQWGKVRQPAHAAGRPAGDLSQAKRIFYWDTSRTIAEDAVAAFLCNLLGLERIGVHQPLTDVSRDALSPADMVAAINQAFHANLPTDKIPRSITVSELTRKLETARRGFFIPSTPTASNSREQGGENPLSPSQKAMWLLDRLGLEGPSNTVMAMRIHGLVDHRTLFRAAGKVIKRHEVLRSTIAMVNQAPQHRLLPPFIPRPVTIDVSGLSENIRDALVYRGIQLLANRQFDVARGPLMHLTIFRLAHDVRLLVFAAHAMTSDQGSVSLLASEVAHWYRELLEDNEYTPRDTPRQFREFARRHSTDLSGETPGKLLAYWKNQLADAPDILRGIDAGKSLDSGEPRYNTRAVPLPDHVVARLAEIPREQGFSYATALIATLKALLFLHSGERDIPVALPTPYRTRNAFAELIGPFSNVLVLRTDLGERLNFQKLMRRVRSTLVDAHAHSDLPFEEQAAYLLMNRKLERFPPYQVKVVIEEEDSEPVLLPSARVLLHHVPVRATPLLLYVAPRPDGPRVALEYDENMFSAETIAKLARQFTVLLGECLAHPEMPLDQTSPWQERFGPGEVRTYRLGETPDLVTGFRLNSSSSLPPITRVKRETEHPLSYGQQRIWFLHQLEPGSAAYNMTTSLKLSGPLDLACLGRAVTALQQRHEILRTHFPARGGNPVQRIVADPISTLRLIDFSAVQMENHPQKIGVLKRRENRGAFDLEHGPLFRAAAIRLNKCEHLLLLSGHRIVTDFWSSKVIVEELSELYKSACCGRVDSSPGPDVQYVDFTHWQHRFFHAGTLMGQGAYWLQQLNHLPPALPLPTDKPRRAARSEESRAQHFALDDRQWQAVNATAKVHGMTPFMVLLSTFFAQLYRYSRQHALVIGAPFTNRAHPETAALIGYFLNTLILRANITEKMTFEELLAQVRRTVVDAYTHQDMPFELLVEALRPERRLSHTPLFNVMLAYRTGPCFEDAFPGLQVSGTDMEGVAAKYDLTLYLEESRGRLIGWMEYAVDLFHDQTVRRMIHHFRNVLNAALASPETPVACLPILTAREHRCLLEAWQPSDLPQFSTFCLHHLFEARATAQPDAIALAVGDQWLTYGMLNLRAGELAGMLRCAGVALETPVITAIGVSLNRFVALLGILKAGGCHVPLEPSLHVERNTFVIKDTGARIRVLETNGGCLHSGFMGQTLYLTANGQVRNHQVNYLDFKSVKAWPGNLACILHTSSTTGRPKGVGVTHGGVVGLIESTRPLFRFNRNDVWTAFHSPTFDFSVWEVWGALAQGGRLVSVPTDIGESPLKFMSLIQRERVTILNLTPGVFIHLVRTALAPEQMRTLPLRLVILGGETLDPHVLREWFARFNRRPPRIVNMYGITETTIHVTHREMVQADTQLGGSFIGSRLPQMSLHILDDFLQPVPIGVAGEIFIGGVGLTRGYIGNPQLTAARFAPDPFSRRGGAVLYRSGDAARFTANGDIQFLGRIDRQLKVKGYRIEPDEIEMVLRRHQAVADAVVSTQGQELETRLIAHVVPRKKDGPPPATLRQYLRGHFPPNMAPSQVVYVASFPRTVNGKVDLSRLPAPDGVDLGPSTDRPETRTEKVLAEVWRGLLNVPFVGTHDDFFELGGHSLLATQLVSRVRETLATEIPLRLLFETPTLDAMAAYVENAGHAVLHDLSTHRRDMSYPLSLKQERVWRLDSIPRTKATLTRAWRLEWRGVLCVKSLARAIDEITRRHDILRTRFTSWDGLARQEIAADQPQNLTVLDFSGLPEQLQHFPVGVDAFCFDLERETPWRVLLARGGVNWGALFLAVHHLLFDEWSWGLFIRELRVSYHALVNGAVEAGTASAALDEREKGRTPLQFVDFAIWQQEHLADERLHEERRHYWKLNLAGAPQLWIDGRKAGDANGEWSRRPIELKPGVIKKLRGHAQQAHATLFMTLLSIYVILLSRISGQDDIVVGTSPANRSRTELEPLIGPISSNLALRCDLSGDPSFDALLKRIRFTALDAYSHQDYPFELLVKECFADRRDTHAPVFQAMFVMENDLHDESMVTGINARVIEEARGEARFALKLSLHEQADHLTGFLFYNDALFNEATAQALVNDLKTLAEKVTDEIHLPISGITLVEAAHETDDVAVHDDRN